jgi:hypothetical protein
LKQRACKTGRKPNCESEIVEGFLYRLFQCGDCCLVIPACGHEYSSPVLRRDPYHSALRGREPGIKALVTTRPNLHPTALGSLHRPLWLSLDRSSSHNAALVLLQGHYQFHLIQLINMRTIGLLAAFAAFTTVFAAPIAGPSTILLVREATIAVRYKSH